MLVGEFRNIWMDRMVGIIMKNFTYLLGTDRRSTEGRRLTTHLLKESYLGWVGGLTIEELLSHCVEGTARLDRLSHSSYNL